MRPHAPAPSLYAGLCVRCGLPYADETYHPRPAAYVSPRREGYEPRLDWTEGHGTIARPVARRTDPDTSWSAARSVKGLTVKQDAVLSLLRELGPMTDEQIAATYDVLDRPRQSPSGLRTRRSELVARGLVRDSGNRATGPTGRRMIVWRAAE